MSQTKNDVEKQCHEFRQNPETYYVLLRVSCEVCRSYFGHYLFAFGSPFVILQQVHKAFWIPVRS